MQSQINEGAEHNDLRGLVNPVVSIDQYKAKVGKDENIIVIAIKVMDKFPAQDLSSFLESGLDAYDVDVSPGPDGDGNYTVFVEIDRNQKSIDSIMNVIQQVKNLDNEFSDIKFTSYEDKLVKDFSKENLESNIIVNSYDYVIKHAPGAKDLEERIKFLKDY